MQGAEKLIISKMLVEHSNRRMLPVSRHAGMAIAGLAADGRVIVNRAADEAATYKSFYGHPIPGHVLTERVASFVHVFNLYWYVRPMGVAALLAAKDAEGYSLSMVDTAGTAHRFYGVAVGKGRQGARNEIEKLKLEEMGAREAVVAVAKILHRVHDEEKPFEMELAWICDESRGEFCKVPEDLAASAEAEAKAALESEDM